MRLTRILLHKLPEHKILNEAPYQFIETNLLQKTILTIGSGLISIFDPHRDDMISAFGELTASQTLPKLHKIMLNDPEGSLLLREKPIINSKTIKLSTLANYPENSFGKEYYEFLIRNNITPDSRKPVLFVKNEEHAYIMRRYREIHDFTHCILGCRTNMLGEVTVKMFEAVQLGLPMCWLAALFGVLRLGPKHTEKYLNTHLEWVINNAMESKPLISVYFEKNFDKPIDEFRRELNLKTLPKS